MTGPDDSRRTPFVRDPVTSPEFARLARVIGGVVKQTLTDNGAEAVILMDPESIEGTFLTLMFDYTGIKTAEYADAATTLTVHPANKTALLVGSFIPRVDILPLGDVYASQLQDLVGEWWGDEQVTGLAKAAGGIEALDAVLAAYIDHRGLVAELTGVTDDVCDVVLAALGRTRFRRARAGIVPKLGTRTIGVDLLD